MKNGKSSNRGISSHFKTEAKIMAGIPIVLGLLAALAGLIGPMLMHYLDVKKCHDAGGFFNTEKGECELPKIEKR